MRAEGIFLTRLSERVKKYNYTPHQKKQKYIKNGIFIEI